VATAAWFATSLLAAVVLAAGSVAIEPYFAPLLLGPLVMGALLGWCTAQVQRFWEVPPGRVSVGILLAVAATSVLAQHVRHFQVARAHQVEQDAKLSAAQKSLPGFAAGQGVGPPPTFFQFLAREAQRGRPYFGMNLRGSAAWFAWGVDGVLVVLAAAGAAKLSLRGAQFCPSCKSWFRVTREGTLDGAGARELAQAVFAPVPDRAEWGAYRLLQCRSGCSDAVLRLSWTVSAAGKRSEQTFESRLDIESRQRVLALLDRLACKS